MLKNLCFCAIAERSKPTTCARHTLSALCCPRAKVSHMFNVVFISSLCLHAFWNYRSVGNNRNYKLSQRFEFECLAPKCFKSVLKSNAWLQSTSYEYRTVRDLKTLPVNGPATAFNAFEYRLFEYGNLRFTATDKLQSTMHCLSLIRCTYRNE